MTQDPITQVYQYLKEKSLQEIREWKPPDKHYWASEIGDCLRKVYYRVSGVKPLPDTVESMLISMEGTMHHDMIRHLMKEAGVVQHAIVAQENGSVTEEYIKKKYEFNGYELVVSGRADGEIETPQGMCVHEVKSIWFWGWDYFQKAWGKSGSLGVVERIKEKYPTWWYQTHFMMDMRGLDNWYLTLKDRNFGKMGFKLKGTLPKGIYIGFDKKILEEGLKRLIVVEKALEAKVPPIHGYKPGDWKCKGCRWRYVCHEAEERENKGEKPYIVYPEIK